MPLYEYQCLDCGLVFEKLQKFSDPPETACPSCGGKVSQLLSAPAVQFKGTGWYVTDYARKPGGGTTKSGESSSGDGSAKKSESKPASDSKPAESKPSSSPSSKKD